MSDGHLFNNILLGGRGGTNPGQLRVHSGGVAWRKSGGGKVIEVEKGNVAGVTWMKVPRSYQLAIRTKDGLSYKFTGFRDQDVSGLTSYIQKSFGVNPEEKHLSVSGRNWGEIDIHGNMLTFLVSGKQGFEVSLADVAQTQLQGKTDVFLEFHVDDTTGANEKDSLMDICFHVPGTNTQFVGDESRPPAQVLLDKISAMADVGSSSEEAVATFDGVAILTPRGRYSVELHLSFFRLQGQANDFKIQYSSVMRLFLLPKSNQPHTFVVITLDPPIRKGQTLYPHIVMQFETDYVVETSLSMSEEQLNSKYKDRLEASYKGLIHDVFTMILRGLCGTKVTRPGKFRSCQDGYAVKSSLKAEDGVLYPLEKSFFFLPKPPTLILYEEIEFVEFERHGSGGSSSMSAHYFDLLVKLRNDQEHLFRNIQRNEYHNLFDFISNKKLKILNFTSGQATNGVAAALENAHDDAVDPHLERIRNAAGEESDEEDEDFVVGKDDAVSSSDNESADDSNASESGEEKEAKKEVVTAKATSKKKAKDSNEEGPKKKRLKKKKDPNAPKRAMSAFMFFSNAERENVKRSNQGIAFSDIGRTLGERWKKMTAEEKEQYEEMAKKDQRRYRDAMAEYKPTNVDSGDEGSD